MSNFTEYDEFLMIGNILVPVYDFSEKVDFRLGTSTRSPNGALQSDVRGEKLAWQANSLLTRTNYNMLKAAIVNDAQVWVSGNALPDGGPTLCIVRMDDVPFEHDEDSEYSYQLNPTITIQQI